MPPKQNPLKLNPLQLRTLTVMQALMRVQGAATRGPGAGEVTIQQFPQPHGDHFHLGEAVVATKDASGLYNEKVWHALERKGLARSDWPHRITLTQTGTTYETGLINEILHRGSH
jgi:ribosomal protein S19E (S16A)